MRGTKAYAARCRIGAVLTGCLLSVLVLYGCAAPQVAVVVQSKYFESVHEVRIRAGSSGLVKFGTLEPRAESAPKTLASGVWDMRAVTKTGLRLSARLRVEGRAQVRITITETGGVQVE